MTATRLLVRQPLHLSYARAVPVLAQHQQRRPFLNGSLTPPAQTLHASRTLPYSAVALYKLIADIASYPNFLPYCAAAEVTSLSGPDQNGRRWPREARLSVGWHGYTESFSSRVFCVPDRVVEAVAGAGKSTLPASDLDHYKSSSSSASQSASASSSSSSSSSSPSSSPASISGSKGSTAGSASSDPASASDVFESLVTRWTLREFPFKPAPPDGSLAQEGHATAPSIPQTDVTLHIEVRFANPVYAALTAAAAPKLAGLMVEAFERRAAEMLGQRD